jgi:membrane protease YdiL (CAAX protease family)
MTIVRAAKPAATALGLLLALGVPLIVMPTGLLRTMLTHLAPTGSVALAELREAFFWGLTILVLVVLRFGEGLKLLDIGWRGPRWTTLLWGVVAFALIYAVQPLGMMLLRSVGGSLPNDAVQRLMSVPFWLLTLTVVRAGVCEEILFRGYGIERLTAFTGSRVIGAVVPALVFMIGHIDTYGIKYVMFLIPVTTVLTGLYLWRRDLWSNMLAHFLTDAVRLALFFSVQRPH